MKKDSCLLRSLGYLKLPELFKKKFGLNSKLKDRLRIFPEPKAEMKEDSESIQIIYSFDKKELEEYVKTVRRGS